jgi:hypothetical protein
VDPQKSFVGQFTHHNFSKKKPAPAFAETGSSRDLAVFISHPANSQFDAMGPATPASVLRRASPGFCLQVIDYASSTSWCSAPL